MKIVDYLHYRFHPDIYIYITIAQFQNSIYCNVWGLYLTVYVKKYKGEK